MINSLSMFNQNFKRVVLPKQVNYFVIDGIAQTIKNVID